MERKPYSRNTVKANSFRVGQIFFWFPSRKAVFHLFGISIQAGKRSFRSSLKDLARQGLNSFTKHKRPVSSEDLEVLYAANQLGLNAPESFANSAWFNTILYFGKRGRENQYEMKPGDFFFSSLKTTTSRHKYFISSEKATKNQSTFKCSRFCIFCVSVFLSSQVFEQYVGRYEPKAPSF